MVLKVSIIIPAYNVEKFVVRTINSLIQQSYDKSLFEVILIDDCSTDITFHISKQLLNKSGLRYKLIRNKENKGPSYSRNVGLKKANGKYVLFLDADDFLERTFLERTLSLADSQNPDLVLSKFKIVDETGGIVKKINFRLNPKKQYSSQDILKAYFSEKFFFQIGTCLFSKEIIDKNKLIFNERFSYGEDIEFFFKYLLLAKRVCVLNEFLLNHTHWNNSLTGKIGEFRFEMIFLFESLSKEINDKEVRDFLLKCRVARELRYLAAGALYSYEDYGFVEKIVNNPKFRDYLKNLKIYSFMDILRKIDIFILLNFSSLYYIIHRLVKIFFPKYALNLL